MSANRGREAPSVSALRKPIHDFPDLIHLAPPATHPNDPLKDVVTAFSRDPGARSVFVTDHDDRLLGSIPERALDLDLLTLAIPEPLWPEIREWDARQLLRATHAHRRIARDLMAHVDALTPDRPLRDAIALMSRGKEPVMPLVDDQGRLLGYLTLFEILASLM